MYAEIGIWSIYAASGVNAVTIPLINIVCTYMATELTEYENRRTDSDFEDALIMKLFVFYFVNSYASFFYIGFIAPYAPNPPGSPPGTLGDCMYSNCMIPLGINLVIIYGSRLCSDYFINIVIPYALYQWNRSKATAQVKFDSLTRPEMEYLQQDYTSSDMSIYNCLAVIIEFGYTFMFIAAAPGAAFFAVILNLLELKGLAWKILEFHQRPVPEEDADIGVWTNIFILIAGMSVITNSALITTLTSSGLAEGGFWYFTILQWVGFVAMFIIIKAIPDETGDVTIQRLRSEFLETKIVNKLMDHMRYSHC